MLEEIIGHKSTLLVLMGVSYILGRLSFYGKNKSDRFSYRALSGISLFVVVSYFARNTIPYIEEIALVICMIVAAWMLLILPGPMLKLNVPASSKRIISIELGSIGFVLLLVVFIWQKS